MADELVIRRRPTLKRPVLITAFRGWNDGGNGASLALGYLQRHWGAETFAEIDPEEFFDFQDTRPTVALEDGLTRRIDWPENHLFDATATELGRDVILLSGVEPNLRWKRFTRLIVDLAGELGVELVITLGALLADVPHTRPSPVTGTASDAKLVEQLGLQASRYEGPTGIVGVLHDAFKTASIPSASLWAAVPHYVSLTPSPRAALALCQRLSAILGGEIDVTELETAADDYARRVSEAVVGDEETLAYVEDLERRADVPDDDDLPTGDALADALTRFLQEREHGNEPPAGPEH